MLSTDQVDAWVKRYVHAWQTADPADIAALFTPDAEYHERPYETAWIGRDGVVTFDAGGACGMFRMWNNQADSQG